MKTRLLVLGTMVLFCFSLSAQDMTTEENFRIVSGSFLNYANAEKRSLDLNTRGLPTEIEQFIQTDRTYYRVLVGPSYRSRNDAKQASTSLDLEYFWIRGPELAGTVLNRQIASPTTPVLTQTIVTEAPIPAELEERFRNRKDPTMGLASGKILDASTGTGIPDVEVQFTSSPQTSLSDDKGIWYLEAPPGTNTLVLHKEGYDFTPVQVEVLSDKPTLVEEQNLVGNPHLDQGTIRFVLTWGYQPKDLDSHLITPNEKHVYFAQKNPNLAGANLDVDDTSSYGPETITITELQSGQYLYLVHNYSGYPDLKESNGMVQIYNDKGLLHTFTIPQEGDGEFWYVGNWVQDHFEPVNKILDIVP